MNNFLSRTRNLICTCIVFVCFTLSFVGGQSGTGFMYNVQYNSSPIGSSTNGFQLTNNFTIEMWIKVNSNQTEWSNIFQIAGMPFNGNAQSGIRLYRFPGENRFHFRLVTTASWNEGCDFPNSIPLNVWTHIAIVLNNNNLLLYQNGALQASCPISPMLLDQSINFYASGDLSVQSTNATLNELRLWNVARNQAQIIGSMMCQIPSQANLVFYYGGPILNPGISSSITSGSQTTCFNTTVTYTAQATNGGSNPIYQWKKNNINVGTNSTTYSTSNINHNDQINCVLTNPILCGASATSNSIIMNISNIWTGAVSQQWNNPANWSCNTVPTGSINIIIPQTANQPIISN